MVSRRRTTNKNPPIFSHEFVIQNHGDIMACAAMFLVAGLLFHVTSPVASMFVVLQHNVTIPSPPSATSTSPQENEASNDVTAYVAGPKDVAAICFYMLITIVMHQIIQEYILDKINRKLHLSKIKHFKFNESGQLFCFYVISIIWAADIIMKEKLFDVRLLWQDYPHVNMSFMLKFFFIIQFAYWSHVFPEFYFQKVKKEDIESRAIHTTLYLGFIGLGYVTSHSRIALCLIVFQYIPEAIFHACRLLSYSDRAKIAKPLYRLYNLLFILARLGSTSVAVLTFWYGLALAPPELQIVDSPSGTYNTLMFRVGVLAAVSMLQIWLQWNFTTFHLSKMREGKANYSVGNNNQAKSKKGYQDRGRGRRKKEDGLDVSELPEVDQDAKKPLRYRK